MKWIVILTRTSAKIFEDQGNKEKDPILLKEMESPTPRERNRAFHNDKPGTDATWVGRGNQYHSMTREKDLHEIAAVEFMKEVMQWLNKSAIEKKVTDLVLVSDSHIYGIVKPLLNPKLKLTLKHVRKNLGKTKIIPSQMHDLIGF